LRRPDLMTVGWGDWSFSLVLHLLLVGVLILLGRPKLHDLTDMVNLDLASLKDLRPPQEEDAEWQKPMLKKTARTAPAVKQPDPPPSNPGPVRSIAQVSQLPHFMSQVKAVYPPAAKNAGVEGVVVVQLELDATGSVMDAQVVQGMGYGCDEAALSAVRQSRFTPAYEGSEPVPVRLRIPYRFKFED